MENAVDGHTLEQFMKIVMVMVWVIVALPIAMYVQLILLEKLLIVVIIIRTVLQI